MDRDGIVRACGNPLAHCLRVKLLVPFLNAIRQPLPLLPQHRLSFLTQEWPYSPKRKGSPRQLELPKSGSRDLSKAAMGFGRSRKRGVGGGYAEITTPHRRSWACLPPIPQAGSGEGTSLGGEALSLRLDIRLTASSVACICRRHGCQTHHHQPPAAGLFPRSIHIHPV